MGRIELPGRRLLDPLPDHAQIPRFVRSDAEADAGHVDQDVGHAAPRDVDGERPETRYLDLGTKVVDECRLVGEADAGDLAVPAFTMQAAQSGRDSSTRSVAGSCIGTMPVSSRTVATHIVLLPDITGYSVDSITT